jgi:predicted RNA-binding protein YlxR (DUF448 family)
VIKTRKTPVRTCVGCGTSSDKREFVRIVRTPDGHVEVDPSGKLNGRGAYVCANRECFTKARLRRRLDHALKVKLHDDDYVRLQRDIDELLAEQGSHQGR